MYFDVVLFPLHYVKLSSDLNTILINCLSYKNLLSWIINCKSCFLGCCMLTKWKQTNLGFYAVSHVECGRLATTNLYLQYPHMGPNGACKIARSSFMNRPYVHLDSQLLSQAGPRCYAGRRLLYNVEERWRGGLGLLQPHQQHRLRAPPGFRGPGR
jgi:hypothetical protein